MKNTILFDFNKEYYKMDFRSKNVLHNAEEWCYTYEGKGNFAVGGWCLYFEEEDDMIMCELRWRGVTD